ncbi:MAG TPA: hypothetical protein VIW92_04240 [Thermoanaerobaculia bacterium]
MRFMLTLLRLLSWTKADGTIHTGNPADSDPPIIVSGGNNDGH